MRYTKLARSSGLLLAAILVTANLSGSAQAAETGAISGTFTDLAGLPLASTSVSLREWNYNGEVAHTTTDASGHYSFTALAAGDYRIEFQPVDYAAQWAVSAATYNESRMITVGGGANVVVDDQVLPFATITGRLTNRDGSGLAANAVSVSGPYGRVVKTDASGYYTAHVRTGTYFIRFPLPTTGLPGDAINQYVPGKDSRSSAQTFDVVTGQTITVNDTVMPTGYLTGTFTDELGAPMAQVSVQTQHTDLSGATLGATTNSAGVWRRRVKTGDFTVFFSSYPKSVSQFAFGKPLRQDAAQFTVPEGQTVAVNDAKLPTGSVRVTAHDAKTGKPITRFDAWLSPGIGSPDQDPEDGVKTFTEVPPGVYDISRVTAYGYKAIENGGQVTVVAHQQAVLDIALQPRTRIDAKIVDAQSGLAVQGVCLFAGTKESFYMGGSPADPSCYPSLGDGTTMVEVPEDAAGSYQLLALPVANYGTRYGAQWVGATNGKGSQLDAKDIAVTAGQVASAPVIKMDRAGTITGTVTGIHNPVPEGAVSLVYHTRFTELGRAPIAGDGTYTIDWLGPYAWALRFDAAYETPQYSGGKGNRHEAERIQVTAGATATYNYTFQPGVPVVLNPPWIGPQCTIIGVNADSGDELFGRTEYCYDGMTFFVADHQKIKIKIYGPSGKGYWHGGTSFTTAYRVAIDGLTHVNIQAGRYVPPVDPAPNPIPVPLPSAPSAPATPRPRETP